MVIIGLLEIFWQVVLPLINVVFPSLPQGFSAALDVALGLIRQGAHLCVWFLFTPNYFSSVVAFIISLYVIAYGLDLLWRVISWIKLRKDSN